MTPDRLNTLLRDLGGSWPAPQEPTALLRALEDAAERRPTDRQLARAVRASHGLAGAGQGVPGTVAGIRRERLVRWDHWTGTWDGTRVATGEAARVRTLRGSAAGDPVLRRTLAREAQVLQALLDGPVHHTDGSWPAIWVALPGAPLCEGAEGPDPSQPETLVRRLATAVRDLRRWEALDLEVPVPSRREWVETGDGLRLICLSPFIGEEAPDALARLAVALEDWWGAGDETSVHPLLAGWQAFPPERVADAAEQLQGALAETLAARWHQLRHRRQHLDAATRAERLHAALVRLVDGHPPPEGRGAVGVDLEGRTLLVDSDGQLVRWGLLDDLQTIQASDGTLSVRQGRRLLRTHAAAPPNPRLQADVDGEAGSVEAICRWVAAALQARTLRLLLENRR